MRKFSVAAAIAALTLVGAGCSATTTPTAAVPAQPAPQVQVPVPAAKYSVGDKVEAKWKGGSFYKGTITAVSASKTYDVSYDDGDKESAVKEENIKLQVAPTPAAAAVVFKVGDKVEAHWKGGQTWWKGSIAKVNADGTYNINYDDGDKESNLSAASVRVRQ